MMEFNSEVGRSRRPVVLYIMLGVAAVVAGLIFFYVRYGDHTPAKASSDQPVVVEGMLRPGNTNFEAYKNRIRIENVKASLGINFAQSRIAIITGDIVNDGDRKLEALEMHIALYDVYDKLVKERTATPLRPGVGLKRPMEPLEKRSFTVYIEPIDQLWNPKRLEIDITGLKYQ